MLNGKTFTCKAYAKINLFLNVFNKTKDNLHNLKSLVCFIDLYDEIVISKSNKFSLKIKGPFKNFIKKRENIIEKTFIIFSKFTGLKTNYKILLNKKIPVSAGLGGGSADAAAVLQGLNHLNKKKVKKKDLFKLAMKIGSDVPACLYNKNVFFSGYGQILSKAPKIPPVSVLLINPYKELSTKKVFDIYKKKKLIKKSNFVYKNFFSWILEQNNDLQKYAEKFIPEIKKMIKFLSSSKNCFFSRMTGSGPTVFGLFRKEIDAKKTNLLLKKNHPKWWSGVYSIKT
ncbi:MAG: 4-(cytidine 5'-diphospho)-2-C-methyl-D-erythritol kinase [Pelagibacteraceae bacterium]|nr:4-(cytidine 5'-diphospho)-2-C-methyl-D-erythritol kinase [Pelagibacteraceae bacterium]